MQVTGSSHRDVLSQVDAEVRPLIEDYRIRDIRYQSW